MLRVDSRPLEQKSLSASFRTCRLASLGLRLEHKQKGAPFLAPLLFDCFVLAVKQIAYVHTFEAQGDLVLFG